MKKFLIFLTVLFCVFSLLQCAGTQKPDPKVVECKVKCDSKLDGCVKKALKNDAKKAACEAAKTKCYGDCDKI